MLRSGSQEEEMGIVCLTTLPINLCEVFLIPIPTTLGRESNTYGANASTQEYYYSFIELEAETLI